MRGPAGRWAAPGGCGAPGPPARAAPRRSRACRGCRTGACRCAPRAPAGPPRRSGTACPRTPPTASGPRSCGARGTASARPRPAVSPPLSPSSTGRGARAWNAGPRFPCWCSEGDSGGGEGSRSARPPRRRSCAPSVESPKGAPPGEGAARWVEPRATGTGLTRRSSAPPTAATSRPPAPPRSDARGAAATGSPATATRRAPPRCRPRSWSAPRPAPGRSLRGGARWAWAGPPQPPVGNPPQENPAPRTPACRSAPQTSLLPLLAFVWFWVLLWFWFCEAFLDCFDVKPRLALNPWFSCLSVLNPASLWFCCFSFWLESEPRGHTLSPQELGFPPSPTLPQGLCPYCVLWHQAPCLGSYHGPL